MLYKLSKFASIFKQIELSRLMVATVIRTIFFKKFKLYLCHWNVPWDAFIVSGHDSFLLVVHDLEVGNKLLCLQWVAIDVKPKMEGVGAEVVVYYSEHVYFAVFVSNRLKWKYNYILLAWVTCRCPG